MYSKTTVIGAATEADIPSDDEPRYTDRDLEDYFAEYLEHFTFDDIRSALFVLEVEEGLGRQARTFKNKKRFKEDNNKALDALEKALVRGHSMCLDTKALEAIETLREQIEIVSATRLDIKREVEADLAKHLENPMEEKLIKDARSFLKQ